MKEITKIFLSGKLSATLVIPIEIARRHGLERPAHVIVEERPEGILIRKFGSLRELIQEKAIQNVCCQSFQVWEGHDMIATSAKIHHQEMMNIDYK